MRTEYITLNHALNCHRLSACEMYVPIKPHFKDKQQHHCYVKAFIFMAVQHSLNLMSLFLTENTHLLIILLVRSEQQKSTRVLCMLQFSRKS